MRLLERLGVPLLGRGSAVPKGFPVQVTLRDGGWIVLDLPEPALLNHMDPDTVGLAVLDSMGVPRALWGLANRARVFRQANTTLFTEIGPLVQSALDGVSGSLYLDGFRYHAGAVGSDSLSDVVILVTNAQDERAALRNVGKSAREAEALKRIGRALGMHQQLQSMATAAVYEITSSAELAAVLLWVAGSEPDCLRLIANTGANRAGTGILSTIAAQDGCGCAAELVASSRKALFIPNVSEHILTRDLEAKFCYLKPRGASILPLVIGDSLVGVLEMVGRDNDVNFLENRELFETIAEHLALAINSCLMYDRVEQLASHDPLTGIANHRSLHEFLSMRIAESLRTKQEIGVVMIDVDHFRAFNEEEGHDAGDSVLKLVAGTLKGFIRPYDCAARYGGEEFTIVLPGSSAQTSLTIAERIRKKIESVPFVTRTGRSRHVTVSMGVASFPHAAGDALELLRAADAALYEAKRTGRNRVVLFQGHLSRREDEAAVDLDPLWRWVPSRSRAALRARLIALRPTFDHLERALSLSASQRQMLDALAIVEGPFRAARKSGEQSPKIRKMRKAEEFRSLLPSLESLDERYDGTGPGGVAGNRIPLLSRILDVAIALVEFGGKPFSEDPGRFDPELVRIVASLAEAA
ncbi:MAG: diguanylate cyclase [Fimbriimonadaceae bacterium]